jgi:hypothetical protein
MPSIVPRKIMLGQALVDRQKDQRRIIYLLYSVSGQLILSFLFKCFDEAVENEIQEGKGGENGLI